VSLTATSIAGLWIHDPTPITDQRGSFARWYEIDEFAAAGFPGTVAQVSRSSNVQAGTVRGMHVRIEPDTEWKVVRCVRGAVLDVVVDCRPESATFLQHHAVELSAANGRAFVIPERCAHGFQTLLDDTEVMYLHSHRYAPRAERGLRWSDPRLALEWPRSVTMISDRDATYPLLDDIWDDVVGELAVARKEIVR
jgi:dTDP-4-dehydrorhamnose 3,5-epimerase